MRFEDGALPETRTFAAYLSALCAGDGASALTPRQVRLLWRALDDARRARHREVDYAAVRLSDSVSGSAYPEIAALLRDCGSDWRPAYVRDELFFVHAINEPVLRLFGVAPTAPGLSRWETWSLLAFPFASPRPVSDAHVGGTLQPATVRSFLLQARRLLFTSQAAVLVRRLEAASPSGFGLWWRAATALLLPESDGVLRSAVLHAGQLLDSTFRQTRTVAVRLASGHVAEYTLGSLDPDTPVAETAFRDLAEGASREPICAARFDAGRDLHVNDWPEMDAIWRARVSRGEV
jgi:hypothetical protein